MKMCYKITNKEVFKYISESGVYHVYDLNEISFRAAASFKLIRDTCNELMEI